MTWNLKGPVITLWTSYGFQPCANQIKARLLGLRFWDLGKRSLGSSQQILRRAMIQRLLLSFQKPFTAFWCDSNHCKEYGLNLSYIK